MHIYNAGHVIRSSNMDLRLCVHVLHPCIGSIDVSLGMTGDMDGARAHGVYFR